MVKARRLMRLTDTDLRFIVETVATRRTDHDHIIELIRDKEDLLEPMLEDSRLFDRLFNDQECLAHVSPFLMFAVLVRRLRRDLEKESFLFQRDANGKRIPVFAAPEAVKLLAESAIRDYLAEMLCSFVRGYTGVLHRDASGVLREQKFSDMDMDDLIALCQLVDPRLKPRLYKRIADVALFFAGIYPAHTSHFVRRRRSQDWRIVRDYERDGRHFYSLVARAPQSPWPPAVFARLSEQFSLAREVLNTLSDRYFKPLGDRYFQQSTG